jgi:hypothetical protein
MRGQSKRAHKEPPEVDMLARELHASVAKDRGYQWLGWTAIDEPSRDIFRRRARYLISRGLINLEALSKVEAPVGECDDPND